MHTRPGERLVVACHGHRDEAHGDRAGLGCEDGLALFLVLCLALGRGRQARRRDCGSSVGGCAGDGGYAKALPTGEGGKRTFFCHGEGCGGELRRGW
jgi:hypothetical protein